MRSQRQFHHLVRTVPGSGRIVCNAADENLAARPADGLLDAARGLRARRRRRRELVGARRWQGDDYSSFEVLLRRRRAGQRATGRSWAVTTSTMRWRRIAAARHAGVPVARRHRGAGRVQGRAPAHGARAAWPPGVRVYDDFAHHPTAIATTIDGLRRRIGSARLVAVLEPRSNTMKLGVHRDTLGAVAGRGR